MMLSGKKSQKKPVVQKPTSPMNEKEQQKKNDGSITPPISRSRKRNQTFY